MSHRPPLDPAAFAADPLEQFERWFADAHASGEPEPEACAVATSGPDGAPSLRMVLLRERDERGFVFYTNYESRKGREIASRPMAAMTFYWRSADHQVRIEGRIERVSAEQSDAYFLTRSRESRIAAIASPQSGVIGDRAALEEAYRRAAENHPAGDPPRPPRWGGFRLMPERVEFWQTGPHRLHDRLCYRREGKGWRIERLAP